MIFMTFMKSICEIWVSPTAPALFNEKTHFRNGFNSNKTTTAAGRSTTTAATMVTMGSQSHRTIIQLKTDNPWLDFLQRFDTDVQLIVWGRGEDCLPPPSTVESEAKGLAKILPLGFLNELAPQNTTTSSHEILVGYGRLRLVFRSLVVRRCKL